MRGGVIIAATAIAAGAAWALARVNHDSTEAIGDWPNLHPEMLGVKAGGDSRRGSGMAADLHETNANQTQQTNSPFALGMGAK